MTPEQLSKTTWFKKLLGSDAYKLKAINFALYDGNVRLLKDANGIECAFDEYGLYLACELDFKLIDLCREMGWSIM